MGVWDKLKTLDKAFDVDNSGATKEPLPVTGNTPVPINPAKAARDEAVAAGKAAQDEAVAPAKAARDEAIKRGRGE